MNRIIEYLPHITSAKDGERHPYLFGSNLIKEKDEIIERYKIDTDITPCNFGGYREWLKCPQCKKRRLTLYWVRDSFKCRVCGKLLYDRQTYTKTSLQMARDVIDRSILLDKLNSINRPFYNDKLTKRADRILSKIIRCKLEKSIMTGDSKVIYIEYTSL